MVIDVTQVTLLGGSVDILIKKKIPLILFRSSCVWFAIQSSKLKSLPIPRKEDAFVLLSASERQVLGASKIIWVFDKRKARMAIGNYKQT